MSMNQPPSFYCTVKPLANISRESGLPYGCISARKLHPEIQNEIFDKVVEAVRASDREKHIAELKKKLLAAMNDGIPDVHVEEDADGLQQLCEYLTDQDEDQHWTYDEPEAEIEYEGVRIAVLYLGGAMILLSLNGEVVSGKSQCSPCVPNAVDLDQGQFPPDDYLHKCHGFPADWFYEEVLSAKQAFLMKERASSFDEFEIVDIDKHRQRLQAGATANVYTISKDNYSSLEDAANSGAVYGHSDAITTGFELDGVIMGAEMTTTCLGFDVVVYIRFID